jgi:curved DNA-binding protein CbpA
MLTNYLKQILRTQPLRFGFATGATRDQVDYYNVLEVEPGATETAIRAAYAELTQGLSPQADSSTFKQLNEAFVILTDLKTRDAYDSLLKVRKTYYLSPEEEYVPSTRSFLAQRRDNKYFPSN